MFIFSQVEEEAKGNSKQQKVNKIINKKKLGEENIFTFTLQCNAHISIVFHSV